MPPLPAIAALSPALGRFLSWWGRELAGLLPAPLAGRRARGRLVVRMEEGAVALWREAGGAAEALGRAGDGAQLARLLEGAEAMPLVLRLPEGAALLRRLWLPAAAEENLRQVLAFEMDRETPFSAEQVVFDFRVEGRDPAARRIEVLMLVAPRDRVEEALAAAAAWGLRPARVEAHTADGLAFDLMPADRRPRPGWGGRAGLVLAGVAALLLVAAVAVGLARRDAAARALEGEVAALRTQAEETARLQDELDRLDRDARVLVERKTARPPMVAVLDELTRVLADDTWATQVEVADGEVQVWGYAPAASVVVRRIEEAPSFRGAEFRSPVVQDGTVGLERFHIAARVVPAEGR